MITFMVGLQEMLPPIFTRLLEDLLHKYGPLGSFHLVLGILRALGRYPS